MSAAEELCYGRGVCSCERCDPPLVACVTCGVLLGPDVAHDVHGPECTWPDIEMCTCSEMACPGCCPHCQEALA